MLADGGARVSWLESGEGRTRVLSRREVANEYGEPYVDYVFLPGEESVPLIRVLAAVVRGDVEISRRAAHE